MPTYSSKTDKTSLQPLALSCENLHVHYGNIIALNNVSFDLPKGEFLYIIGPNGAGKSTLVKVLVDLLKPDMGNYKVHVNGVGFLPQMLNLKNNFPITVNEVIYGGFKKQHLRISRKDQDLMDYWMAKMGVSYLRNQMMSTLSGGQQQRIYLIRALISNPELLILDEPTSALDPEFRQTFHVMIESLHKAGTTVILVTHDLGEQIKDEHLVMRIDRDISYYGDYKTYKSQFTGGHHHV